MLNLRNLKTMAKDNKNIHPIGTKICLYGVSLKTKHLLYTFNKKLEVLHLYNGQEAILAGCGEAIDPTKDKMITAYRNHVQPIAMGVEPKYVMAELMGKITGCFER